MGDVMTFGILELIGAGLIALFTGFLGLKAGDMRGKRKGRQEAEQEAKNADYENAADIRRAADDAEGVRDDSPRGYRPRK